MPAFSQIADPNALRISWIGFADLIPWVRNHYQRRDELIKSATDLAEAKFDTLSNLSSNFVIEGASTPIPGENYRAKAVFEWLSVWLRTHGVTARKPIHELRKEFGSMINRKHGLSAASDQLRHSGIAITAAYYIDRPRAATSGLGALLEPKRKGKKIVEFRDANAAQG